MLEKLNNKNFDQIYNLMKISFPIEEYRLYEEQKKLLDNPFYSIYVLNGKNEEIKAFVALWDFVDFLYIEHLVVSPEYRNDGIGSKILNNINKKTKKMICLEVEPPENALSIRRINFYQRNNFYFNDYPYMQPPMSKGKKAIPLYIMTSNMKIDNFMFEKIKKTLYKEVYKYYEY